MKDITTVKLRRETKKRLDNLKEHKRESYEEVLRKILYILNLFRKEPEKAGQMLRRLDVTVKGKGKGYTKEYPEGKEEN